MLFSDEPQCEIDENDSNAESDSDVESDDSLCMLGVESVIALSSEDNLDYEPELCLCGRAHKRDCPFNPGRKKLPPSPHTALSMAQDEPTVIMNSDLTD